MAGGLPDGHLVEFETVPGNWVDVSADVSGVGGVTTNVGRATSAEDAQPSDTTIVMRNPTGRWTPDNPGSDLYPYVVEGKRIRHTITSGATVSKRGTWRIRNYSMTIGSVPESSTVTVTAMGRMAALGRWEYQEDLTEYISRQMWPIGDTCDIFPMRESGTGSPKYITNAGNSGDPLLDPADDPAVQDGIVIKARNGKGQVTYTSADGLLVDQALSFSPNDGVGPVVKLVHQPDPHVFGMFFRTTAQPKPGEVLVIAQGRSDGRGPAGVTIVSFLNWELRVIESSGKYPLQLVVNPGSVTYTLDANVSDGAWHSFIMLIITKPGTASLYYDAFSENSVFIGVPSSALDTDFVILGGAMNRFFPGQQQGCPPVEIAHPWFQGAYVSGGYEAYGFDNIRLADSTGRFLDLRSWINHDSILFYESVDSTDVRSLAWKSSAGRSALEVMLELARTMGVGTLWEQPSTDRILLIRGASMRPIAPAFTVQLGVDDDGSVPQVWQRGTVNNPTRQTVNGPLGDATYIDSDAEVIDRRDGPAFGTVVSNKVEARSLASWWVRHRKTLGLRQLGLDAVTAGSNLWASLLAMRPGTRIQVTGVSAAVVGRTTVDVHAVGWTETHTLGGSKWKLNTEPADSPAELSIEDDVYSAFDFAEGASVVDATTPMTTSSTSFKLATTGGALTIDPAEYPLYLTIGTEDMTVPNPPGLAISPQTLIVVRGQRGSIPAAHPAGSVVHLTPLAGFAP